MSGIMRNEFGKEMSEKVKKSEKIEIKRKVSIRSILKLNNSSKFLKRNCKMSSSSNSVIENVVVVGVVKKEVKPKLPAKYVRIYQCVWEVLNSCVTEPSNGVAVTEELMEGILGVMGFYGELSEQMEFFNESIFEKESLKATKKGMKAHLKLMKMKSEGGSSEEVPEKKKREKKVKDPNAPKKVRAPRKKKEVVVEPEAVVEPEVVVVPEVVVSEPEVVVPEVVVDPEVVVVQGIIGRIAGYHPEPVVTTPVMEEKKKEKVFVKKAKKTTKVLVDVPSEN